MFRRDRMMFLMLLQLHKNGCMKYREELFRKDYIVLAIDA